MYDLYKCRFQFLTALIAVCTFHTTSAALHQATNQYQSWSAESPVRQIKQLWIQQKTMGKPWENHGKMVV